jgi:hypothetical protein
MEGKVTIKGLWIEYTDEHGDTYLKPATPEDIEELLRLDLQSCEEEEHEEVDPVRNVRKGVDGKEANLPV